MSKLNQQLDAAECEGFQCAFFVEVDGGMWWRVSDATSMCEHEGTLEAAVQKWLRVYLARKDGDGFPLGVTDDERVRVA